MNYIRVQNKQDLALYNAATKVANVFWNVNCVTANLIQEPAHENATNCIVATHCIVRPIHKAVLFQILVRFPYSINTSIMYVCAFVLLLF